MTTSTDSEITEAKILLHVDSSSVGIYAWPISVAQMSTAESQPQTTTPMYEARLIDGVYKITDALPWRVPANARLRPTGTAAIGEWLKMSRTSAWMWLLAAIPGFWLSRHRLGGDLRVLRDPRPGTEINLSERARKRARDRGHLVAHAASLKQKSWSIRYHRAQFAEAIEKIVKGKDRASNLVIASAEFMAHDAAIYALLDELALLVSLVNKIAKGKDTPTSFSKLAKAHDVEPNSRA